MNRQYDNISVTAFILWQHEALLVQRASDEDFLPDHWEQVGGKVNAGESQKEAIIREVKEEVGIDVEPIRSYHRYEYTHPDGRSMRDVAFICKLVREPVVRLSSEHRQCRWIGVHELENIKPMTDEMREVVKKGFQVSKVG